MWIKQVDKQMTGKIFKKNRSKLLSFKCKIQYKKNKGKGQKED